MAHLDHCPIRPEDVPGTLILTHSIKNFSWKRRMTQVLLYQLEEDLPLEIRLCQWINISASWKRREKNFEKLQTNLGLCCRLYKFLGMWMDIYQGGEYTRSSIKVEEIKAMSPFPESSVELLKYCQAIFLAHISIQIIRCWRRRIRDKKYTGIINSIF